MLRCNVCRGLFDQSKRSNCPKCGNSKDFSAAVAERVYLFNSGKRISFHKTVYVERNNFRVFAPDHCYVSDNQFSLIKMAEHWMIKGSTRSVNPTYLNGIEIGLSPAALKDGDEIFIGNIATKTGLALSVSFS